MRSKKKKVLSTIIAAAMVLMMAISPAIPIGNVPGFGTSITVSARENIGDIVVTDDPQLLSGGDTISPDKEIANEGDTVTLTVTPGNPDYTVTPVVNGGAVDVTDNGDGTWSFIMPKGNAAVTAVYGFADGLGALVGHSISLEGDLAVNYIMDLDDSVLANADTAYVQFTAPAETGIETQSVLVKEAEIREVNGKVCYIFKCRVSAANMTSPVTAQLVNGTVTGTPHTCSVKDYADEMLADTEAPDYAVTAPLVKAMLNYGAASQAYFDPEIESENLANASLSGEDKVIADVTPAMIKASSPKTTLTTGTKFASATMSLHSEITLSIYLTSKKAPTDAVCGDYKIDATTSGSYKVLRIRGINVADLDKDFTVTFKIGSRQCSVTYCPMYYCRSVLQNKSAGESLKTLVNSLYWYKQFISEYLAYYGELKATSVDVIFDPNGGEGEMADQAVYFDSTVNLNENAFTRTGYSFAGWSKTPDGKAIYVDGSYFTMAGFELYAQWTANNYNVVFNANGGTGNMTDQTIAYDSTANLTSNAFTKTGYNFAGWATTSNGSVEYTDGDEYTMETVGGATLYAKWTANNYVVIFSSNGGTGDMEKQSIAYDSTANLTANTFTRTG